MKCGGTLARSKVRQHPQGWNEHCYGQIVGTILGGNAIYSGVYHILRSIYIWIRLETAEISRKASSRSGKGRKSIRTSIPAIHDNNSDVYSTCTATIDTGEGRSSFGANGRKRQSLEINYKQSSTQVPRCLSIIPGIIERLPTSSGPLLRWSACSGTSRRKCVSKGKVVITGRKTRRIIELLLSFAFGTASGNNAVCASKRVFFLFLPSTMTVFQFCPQSGLIQAVLVGPLLATSRR